MLNDTTHTFHFHLNKVAITAAHNEHAAVALMLYKKVLIISNA